MKRLRYFLPIVLLFFTATVFACEISFMVVENNKDSYSQGDEFIIEVQVVLTHRVCPIELKDTQFTYQGVKVLGATPWKEVKPGTYTRKIKVQATQSDKGNIILTATRTCEKEGGVGSIKLKLQ